MSLVSRLSGFFLATLAAVLLGFSLTLYLLAADHLQRQVEERLNASLATLAAAAEVGPGGVEWEPRERDLGLGRDNGPDQIRWIVRDDRGRLLDRSTNFDPRRLLPLPAHGIVDGPIQDQKGRTWQTKTRLVAFSDRSALRNTTVPTTRRRRRARFAPRPCTPPWHSTPLPRWGRRRRRFGGYS